MSSWEATIRNSWLYRVKSRMKAIREEPFTQPESCPSCRKSKREYGNCCNDKCRKVCPAKKDCKAYTTTQNLYKEYSDNNEIMAQFCLEMYWKRGGKFFKVKQT